MSGTGRIEGVFETMLVVNGRIVLEREHFERMARAAREIGAAELEAGSWSAAIREVLSPAERAGEHGVRCIYQSDASGEWALSAEAFSLPAATLRRRRYGRVALLPPVIRRTDPGVKSLDWLAEVRRLRQTLAEDVDEGLLTNEDGRILEGTSTNVFAIDDDTLLTPPLDAGVLPGIVRDWVICNAPRVGFSVRFRLLGHEDLIEGSFLTSSLSRLSAIREVDGDVAAEPGERFRELAELFDGDVG